MSRPSASSQPSDSAALAPPVAATTATGEAFREGTLYDGSPRRFRVAALLLLALFAVLAVASVAREAMTYDEPVHLRYGAQILDGDATRFDDSKMPLSAFNALPGRLAARLEPGPLRAALESDLAARVPTILFSLGLGLLVLVWAERLYGPRGGLLALALFVFDPNLLAHGRLVTTDLYAALFLTLALFTYQRFLAVGGTRAGLAAAAALAVAQLAKYTAVYLYPIYLLLALVRFGPHLADRFRGRRFGALGRDLGRAAAWAVVFGLASLAVINVGFLFERTFEKVSDYRFRSDQFRELQATLGERTAGSAWDDWLRVPVPYPYLEGMDWVLQRERTGDGYGNVYLLGHTRSGRGFPGYFFVATALKVPLATLALVGLALVLYWRRRRRYDFLSDELFLLGPVLVFTIYFNFLFQAQMGIRHFLVVFPLLYVFAGSLVAPEVAPPLRPPGEPRPRRERLRLWAPWVLAALAGISVLASFPRYISYFNLLVPRERAYRVLADSNLDWGQTEPEIAAWLAEHPQAIVDPPQPTAGLILAETNWFVGVFHRKKNRWIPQDLEPDGHVAYTHLLFDIDEDELRQLLTVGRTPD